LGCCDDDADGQGHERGGGCQAGGSGAGGAESGRDYHHEREARPEHVPVQEDIDPHWYERQWDQNRARGHRPCDQGPAPLGLRPPRQEQE
jgi:hypothetical protein